MKIRLSAFSILALALLLVTGCVNREAQKSAKRTAELIADDSIAVEVVPVESRPFSTQIEITGSLQTGDDSQVGAKVAGRITAVYVKDGDAVSAGQVIARQETGDALRRLRQAQAAASSARSQYNQALADLKQGPVRTKASVASAQAQLNIAQASLEKLLKGARDEERRQATAQVDSARSNMETARREMERNDELLRQGAISQSAADQTRNAYRAALSQYESALEAERILQNGARSEDIAAARQQVAAAQEQVRIARSNQNLDVQFQLRVESARASVESAEESVALARQAIDDATIRSPFSGNVSGTPLQAGTYVAPGTPVARVVSRGSVYFEGQVPEAQISQVQPGMPIGVKVTSVDREFAGRVAGISPVGANVGRIFKVRVVLEGETGELRPGMFARGYLDVDKIEDALVVPTATVIRGTEGATVFEAAGTKAVVHTIKVLGEQGGFTRIDGLPEGMQIVVRGQDKLANGAKIKIQSSAAKPSEPTSPSNPTQPGATGN
ncbi:MAG: efflux RND transporter periplasmic adaptor subunit [Armatimonadetes bacterium]|nr:efflux RND transporter periplasmic adaptor subunit [Armatimonadota bacterium]